MTLRLASIGLTPFDAIKDRKVVAFVAGPLAKLGQLLVSTPLKV